MTTTAAITVAPVTSRREHRIFLRFPWRIYRDDPLWVPYVLSERADRLNPARNALFQTGEVALFIAWRGREPAGTVATAIDPAANAHHNERTAVFGFFECVDDETVARALFDRTVAWSRARDMRILRGPQSFGAADEPGVLIEGRETPRGMLMGWSRLTYRGFFERYGFRKFQDSLAYRIYLKEYIDENGIFHPPRGVDRIAARVRERYGDRVRLRLGNLKDIDGELEIARCIYNASLTPLPEFTPVSREEWRRMATAIQPLLDPDFVPIVEVDGRPIAFGLGLPDINQALWHCNGLRMPWEYVKLWWTSRHLPGVSFKIMAMVPDYHGQGLDALIYTHIAETAFRKGFAWIDLSLTGDDNPTTNRMLRRTNATIDKRYRTYELVLD